MSSVIHDHAGPLTFELSAGSASLLWIGSHIKAGLLVFAAYDFTQATADLAHLGGFLMAVAAFGTFCLQVHDRIRGRHR